VPQHRFQKGNTYGKGNPHAVKMHQYYDQLFKAIGKKKFKDLALKIYERAMKGDMIAARLLVERLCGKLKETTEISVSNNENTEGLTIILKKREQKKDEDSGNSDQ
jgi:hypothetical protein